MKNVKIHRIPARHECQQRNVAAYCRVSTLSEAQEESFETQKDYYTRYIMSNPNWTLVEVYAEMLTPSLIQMHPTCTQIAP